MFSLFFESHSKRTLNTAYEESESAHMTLGNMSQARFWLQNARRFLTFEARETSRAMDSFIILCMLMVVWNHMSERIFQVDLVSWIGRTTLLIPWAWTLSLWNCEEINFCSLSHPGPRAVWRQPQQMNICKWAVITTTYVSVSHPRVFKFLHAWIQMTLVRI